MPDWLGFKFPGSRSRTIGHAGGAYLSACCISYSRLGTHRPASFRPVRAAGSLPSYG
jgi:hypothetical protein